MANVVTVLVKAGAALDLQDKVAYHTTPVTIYPVTNTGWKLGTIGCSQQRQK